MPFECFESESLKAKGCWNRRSCMPIDQSESVAFFSVGTHQSHWEFRRRRKAKKEICMPLFVFVALGPSTLKWSRWNGWHATRSHKMQEHNQRWGKGQRLHQHPAITLRRHRGWRVWQLRSHCEVSPKDEVCLHTKRLSRAAKCCPGRATQLLQAQTMQVRVG